MEFSMSRSLRRGTVAATVLLAVACGGDASGASDSGSLTIIVTTTGASRADVYAVQVGASAARSLQATDSTVVSGLVPGPTTVTLSGIAADCAVTGGASRSVAVAAGDTTRVTFGVACIGTATVTIVASATGFDLDPDGYDVLLDGTPAGHIDPQGSLALTVSSGTHIVAIGGVSPNCQFLEVDDRSTITVKSGTTVSLTARCGYLLLGGYFLSVSSLDGLSPKRLTEYMGVLALQPAWSPDGGMISFGSGGGPSGIHTVHSDGSSLTRLTSGADHAPAWSPDGSRIAFQRAEASGVHIWVMNADGSDSHPLPNGGTNDQHPTWSPDGVVIAFSCTLPLSTGICAERPDGSDRRTVYSTDSTDAVYPAWSPDGTRLAFSEALHPNFTLRLSLVNADGTGYRQLTSGLDAYLDEYPEWSLDGKTIVFVRDDLPSQRPIVHTVSVTSVPIPTPTGIVTRNIGGVQPR